MTTSCKPVAQVVTFPTFMQMCLVRKSGKVAIAATDYAELCPSNYSADPGAVCPETARDKSSGASGFRVCFPLFSISFLTWRKMGKKPCITTLATDGPPTSVLYNILHTFRDRGSAHPRHSAQWFQVPFLPGGPHCDTRSCARQKGRGCVESVRPAPTEQRTKL